MKVCVEWWTALSAYVDDALGVEERERVEQHLQQCASCRGSVAMLQALRRSVSLLPQQEPPPMLKARILSATVDKPTWSEQLMMHWRPMVWRASLAAAVLLVGLLVWRLMPRQVPEAVQTLVSSVTQSQTTPSPSLAQARPAQTQRAVVSPQKPIAMPRSSARSGVVAKATAAPRREQWSSVRRVTVAPQPAPADALHGEPVIEPDVPYIDVNSPLAGEEMAHQAEEENTTVATRYTLPAEVVSQGTQGLEALREQIRLRTTEQLSGRIERSIERKQVEVDVIKVRF